MVWHALRKATTTQLLLQKTVHFALLACILEIERDSSGDTGNTVGRTLQTSPSFACPPPAGARAIMSAVEDRDQAQVGASLPAAVPLPGCDTGGGGSSSSSSSSGSEAGVVVLAAISPVAAGFAQLRLSVKAQGKLGVAPRRPPSPASDDRRPQKSGVAIAVVHIVPSAEELSAGGARLSINAVLAPAGPMTSIATSDAVNHSCSPLASASGSTSTTTTTPTGQPLSAAFSAAATSSEVPAPSAAAGDPFAAAATPTVDIAPTSCTTSTAASAATPYATAAASAAATDASATTTAASTDYLRDLRDAAAAAASTDADAVSTMAAGTAEAASPAKRKKKKKQATVRWHPATKRAPGKPLNGRKHVNGRRSGLGNERLNLDVTGTTHRAYSSASNAVRNRKPPQKPPERKKGEEFDPDQWLKEQMALTTEMAQKYEANSGGGGKKSGASGGASGGGYVPKQRKTQRARQKPRQQGLGINPMHRFEHGFAIS